MLKKTVKKLYIIADEDHVHLQKGGIEEPRLIIVYDSIIVKGKRIELKNKKHFGGIYTNKIDDLWEEVMTYIENNYDTEYLERVYISGDGANWIKTGLEWIIKSIYVLDEFHMKKAVNGIVGRITKTNKEEKEKQKRELRTAKEDNISTEEILNNSKKVIEIKEIQKIRNQANASIKKV